MRTTEKLFEELLIGTSVTGTDHPMIMRAIEHHLSWTRMQQMGYHQLVALASFDCHRAVALLAEALAECQAEVDIRDTSGRVRPCCRTPPPPQWRIS